MVLAASVVGLLPFAASADTITENFTITVPPTTLTDAVESFGSTSFLEFDPSLGTLNSIMVSLTGSTTYTAASDGDLVSLGLNIAGTAEELADGGFAVFDAGVHDVSAAMSGTDSFGPDLARFLGTGQTLVDFEVTGNSGDTVQTNGDLSGSITYNFTEAAPVPEPATISLLGFGVVGLAVLRRRRAV